MKEKTIDIKIYNGKLFSSNVTDRQDNEYSNPELGLKEIAIINEVLKKEQEKIMNRQKDEANKSKVGVGKTDTTTAIELPEDASLSLVIRFLNDLHVDFKGDNREAVWRKYRVITKTIHID